MRWKRARGILRPSKRVRQGSKRKRNHRAGIAWLPIDGNHPCLKEEGLQYGPDGGVGAALMTNTLASYEDTGIVLDPV